MNHYGCPVFVCLFVCFRPWGRTTSCAPEFTNENEEHFSSFVLPAPQPIHLSVTPSIVTSYLYQETTSCSFIPVSLLASPSNCRIYIITWPIQPARSFRQFSALPRLFLSCDNILYLLRHYTCFFYFFLLTLCPFFKFNMNVGKQHFTMGVDNKSSY